MLGEFAYYANEHASTRIPLSSKLVYTTHCMGSIHIRNRRSWGMGKGTQGRIKDPSGEVWLGIFAVSNRSFLTRDRKYTIFRML